MNGFQGLVGEQLSAVCFVHDYIQLQFDGYQLTTYTTPVVETAAGHYVAYADEQYKNSLCRFIARRVHQVQCDEQQVTITFTECVESLVIPLHEGVDNIAYVDPDEKWFVL